MECVKSSKALMEQAVERQVLELEREAQYRKDAEEAWLQQTEELQQKVRL